MIGSSCAEKHFISECGMVKAAWVWRWAFPRELPPEIFSRSGRVTPLHVASVFALLSAPNFGESWVVPRKLCLSSRVFGMEGFFIYKMPF